MSKKLIKEEQRAGRQKGILEGWMSGGMEVWRFKDERRAGRQEGKLFNNSSIDKIPQKPINDTDLSPHSPIALSPQKSYTSIHPDLYTSKKAFTLAEVLITLAVVGIISAITLPILIKNYQKHTYVNALKANYTMLNQGFQKMMADDEVTNIFDTNVWNQLDSRKNCYYAWGTTHIYCKNFFSALKSYFKILSFDDSTNYKYKQLNNVSKTYNGNSFVLSNGAIIFWYEFWKTTDMSANNSLVTPDICNQIKEAGGHMCYYAAWLTLDVNGTKGPNILGRDIFRFFISENGNLIPSGGKDYAIWKSALENDITNFETYKVNKENQVYDCKTVGLGCAGYLIDESNWKMDY